jgi:hypothetical protein
MVQQEIKMKVRSSVFTVILRSVLLNTILCTGLFADAGFASVQGTVLMYENQKWIKVNTSTRIKSGAIIQTAYRSRALVTYATGGQLAIGPNTKVTIFDNVAGAGTDREVLVEHGELSAFVKKGNGSGRNNFRMRTPTIVAGVRGSLLAGILEGQTLSVKAIQSAARIETAVQSEQVKNVELLLASARKAVAEQQDLVARTKEYVQSLKAELTKLGSPGDAQAALRVNRLVSSINLYSNNVNIYEATQAKFEKIERNLDEKVTAARATLLAIASEEKQMLKDLASGSVIKEGDAAKGNAAGITTPVTTQNASTRPVTLTTVGQTGTEQVMTSQSDVKVGVGADFQQIYNSVNIVTQPTSTGLPTLKKF